MKKNADSPRRVEAVDSSIVRGAQLADLAAFYDPEVMLVTAPLAPGRSARLYARELAGIRSQQTKLEVATPDGRPKAGGLDELAVLKGPSSRAWVAYVDQVTAVFATLLGAKVVGVRQIVSEGPHCPRFHVDRVLARGVLNVLGACTEWLDESAVDRSRLGHAGGALDATSGLVRRWSRLDRASEGSLSVFKGTAWAGAENRAIVHRSPPPARGARVLLTLDWLE